MVGDIKYSLVLATLGRGDTVERFLASLAAQTYPLGAVEIIIVDQNKNGLLDDIVSRYSGVLNLTHVKSDVLGLSVNRNIGLERAVGEVVAFPDDDCEYPADLLANVDASFSAQNATFILGSIWDDKQNRPAIRNWPGSPVKLNRFNFYRLTSSITLFSKDMTQRFDERFGLGAPFGSNEDAIFVYSLLKSGNEGVYLPGLRVYHEDQPLGSLDARKVASYAKGFGRFAREYASAHILAIFLASVLFQSIGLVKSGLCLDFRTASLRATSLKWRIMGYFA